MPPENDYQHMIWSNVWHMPLLRTYVVIEIFLKIKNFMKIKINEFFNISQSND